MADDITLRNGDTIRAPDVGGKKVQVGRLDVGTDAESLVSDDRPMPTSDARLLGALGTLRTNFFPWPPVPAVQWLDFAALPAPLRAWTAAWAAGQGLTAVPFVVSDAVDYFSHEGDSPPGVRFEASIPADHAAVAVSQPFDLPLGEYDLGVRHAIEGYSDIYIGLVENVAGAIFPRFAEFRGDVESRPLAGAPAAEGVDSGGTLALGSYTYVVTVLRAEDGAESLPSDPVTIELTGDQSAVLLNWSPGQDSWNVYREVEGAFELLGSTSSDSTFMDDGAAEPQAGIIPPLEAPDVFHQGIQSSWSNPDVTEGSYRLFVAVARGGTFTPDLNDVGPDVWDGFVELDFAAVSSPSGLDTFFNPDFDLAAWWDGERNASVSHKFENVELPGILAALTESTGYAGVPFRLCVGLNVDGEPVFLAAAGVDASSGGSIPQLPVAAHPPAAAYARSLADVTDDGSFSSASGDDDIWAKAEAREAVIVAFAVGADVDVTVSGRVGALVIDLVTETVADGVAHDFHITDYWPELSIRVKATNAGETATTVDLLGAAL